MNTNELICWAIVFWSSHYGVDFEVAFEVARLESGFNPNAIGDDGKAVGIWQWHKQSYDVVVDEMYDDGELAKGETIGSRRSIWASTRVAMYAMGKMNLYDWWATYPEAIETVEERR